MLAEDAASVEGTVSAIEYQGNYVKVMLDAAGEDEFVAFVPERKFFENNLTVGEKVLAVWQVTHTQVMA